MKKKILLIDDSLPIRFLLEAMLDKKYSTISAQDGLGAIMWLMKGNTPDAIITDLAMPNVNGWELLDYLSDSDLYKDIPVVVLSGSIETETTAIMDRYSNVVEVMAKPFDPVQLLTKVETVFNTKSEYAAPLERRAWI